MSATGPERTSPDPSGMYDDTELIATAGGHYGPVLIEMLRAAMHLRQRSPHPAAEEKPKGPYDWILAGRPKIDIVDFMKGFRKATHFTDCDEDLVTIGDPIGLERILPPEKAGESATVETYPDKQRKERAKGRNESVSYGIGRIGGNKFVGLIFNWEFMVGSSGVVAGEKFIRAMHLATDAASEMAEKEGVPMLMVCASAGQRIQEAVAALREMIRTSHALNQFKKKTNKLLAIVEVGNMWGGLTATAPKQADLVISMAGTDRGFAGPGVIAAYEGQRPPVGVQTAENSFATNRSVHVVLNNQAELLAYLKKLLDIQAHANQAPEKPKRFREITGLDFDSRGFHIPFRPERVFRKHPRTAIPMPLEPINPKRVWDQHKVLLSDPRQPDTIYILQHAFDGFVPLFSGRVEEDEDGKHLIYPGIVAAIAYIDDPRLQKRLMRLVIGNQRSYLQQPDGTIMADITRSKSPTATPTAWDYRYQLRMMKDAARWGYGITTFVNTLGARPSTEDEMATLSDAISDCLDAQLDFPFFTNSYNVGIGGSGGHLATCFTADYVAMLGGDKENEEFPDGGAFEFIAEPESATSMLNPRGYKTSDVQRTAEGMKPTASFLLEKGLVDNVIWTPKGGAHNKPLETVLALREDLIQVELKYGHLTPEEVLQRRIDRLERRNGSMPIPMGRLSGRKPESLESRLTRFRRLLHFDR